MFGFNKKYYKFCCHFCIKCQKNGAMMKDMKKMTQNLELSIMDSANSGGSAAQRNDDSHNHTNPIMGHYKRTKSTKNLDF